MTDARKRLLGRGWAVVPTASGPLGGGMLKLGHGSTVAALTVALAPYGCGCCCCPSGGPAGLLVLLGILVAGVGGFFWYATRN